MRNLTFIIWILGWFFLIAISRYLNEISPYYTGYSDEVKGITAGLQMLVLVIVGYLVYERKGK